MTPEYRGVAVFDLDGTVARGDTFRAYLCHYLSRTPGRWHTLPGLAAALAMFAAHRRDNAWLKSVVLGKLLGEASPATVARHADNFVARLLASAIRADALATIAERRSQGWRLLLATASPDVYVAPLARRLGFDDVLCTCLPRDIDGLIARKADIENCYGQMKADRVLAWRADTGLTGPLWAYSDHHADLPLLQAADVAFGICATPRLRALAPAYGIQLVDWR